MTAYMFSGIPRKSLVDPNLTSVTFGAKEECKQDWRLAVFQKFLPPKHVFLKLLNHFEKGAFEITSSLAGAFKLSLCSLNLPWGFRESNLT